jgi:hypothetical protein
MSDAMIKQHLVRFLTPIIGRERARHRVLSGFRGGGEMELKELGAPTAVRATLGWWRAKLLAMEGALITYEGASVEQMALWSSRLGSRYMFVHAPGVYSTTPPAQVERSITRRVRCKRILQQVIQRAAALRAALQAAGMPEPAR